jgi:hypothetical protein
LEHKELYDGKASHMMVFTIWSGLGKERDIRDNFGLECFECKIDKVRNVRMRE